MKLAGNVNRVKPKVKPNINNKPAATPDGQGVGHSASSAAANNVPDTTKTKIANLFETDGKCCSQYIELGIEDSSSFSDAINLNGDNLLKNSYSIANTRLNYAQKEKIFHYNYLGKINNPARTQAIVRLSDSAGKLQYLLLKNCGSTIEIHIAQPNVHDLLAKGTSSLMEDNNQTALIPWYKLKEWFPDYTLSEAETTILVDKIKEVAQSCTQFNNLLPQSSYIFTRNTQNKIIKAALQCVMPAIGVKIKTETHYTYEELTDSSDNEVDSDSDSDPDFKLLTDSSDNEIDSDSDFERAEGKSKILKANRKRSASNISTSSVQPPRKRQHRIEEATLHECYKSLCIDFLRSQKSKAVIPLSFNRTNTPVERTARISISNKELALMIAKTVLPKWENEYNRNFNYSAYFSKIKELLKIYTPNNTRLNLQKEIRSLFDHLYSTFECPLVNLEAYNLSTSAATQITEDIPIFNDNTRSSGQINPSDFKLLFQGKQQIILEIPNRKEKIFIFMFLTKEHQLAYEKVNVPEAIRTSKDKLYIFKIYKKISHNFADQISKVIFNELKIKFLELYTTFLPHLNSIDKNLLEADYKIMINMHTTLKIQSGFTQTSDALTTINELFKSYLTPTQNEGSAITQFNTIEIPTKWLDNPEQLTALDDIVLKKIYNPTREAAAMVHVISKHCTHEFLVNTIKPQKFVSLMKNISWEQPITSKDNSMYALALLDAYLSTLVKNYDEQNTTKIDELLQPYTTAMETLVKIFVNFNVTPKLAIELDNTQNRNNVILCSGLFYTFQQITTTEFNNLLLSKQSLDPAVIYVVSDTKHYTINNQMQVIYRHHINTANRDTTTISISEDEWNRNFTNGSLTAGNYIVRSPFSYRLKSLHGNILQVTPIEGQQQTLNDLYNKKIMYNQLVNVFNNWNPEEPIFELKRDTTWQRLELKQKLTDQDLELLSTTIRTNTASKEILNIFKDYCSHKPYRYLTAILPNTHTVNTSFTILFLSLINKFIKNKEFDNAYNLYKHLLDNFVGRTAISLPKGKIMLDIITELLLATKSASRLTLLLDDPLRLITPEILNKLKSVYTDKIKTNTHPEKYAKLLAIVDEQLKRTNPLAITTQISPKPIQVNTNVLTVTNSLNAPQPESRTHEEASTPTQDNKSIINPGNSTNVGMTEANTSAEASTTTQDNKSIINPDNHTNVGMTEATTPAEASTTTQDDESRIIPDNPTSVGMTEATTPAEASTTTQDDKSIIIPDNPTNVGMTEATTTSEFDHLIKDNTIDLHQAEEIIRNNFADQQILTTMKEFLINVKTIATTQIEKIDNIIVLIENLEKNLRDLQTYGLLMPSSLF